MRIRSFRDGRGNRWNVRQVSPSSDAAALYGGLRKGWLCFESEHEKRRLPVPPAGWREWPDEALERLCEAAVPTPVRARAEPGPMSMPLP